MFLYLQAKCLTQRRKRKWNWVWCSIQSSRIKFCSFQWSKANVTYIATMICLLFSFSLPITFWIDLQRIVQMALISETNWYASKEKRLTFFFAVRNALREEFKLILMRKFLESCRKFSNVRLNKEIPNNLNPFEILTSFFLNLKIEWIDEFNKRAWHFSSFYLLTLVFCLLFCQHVCSLYSDMRSNFRSSLKRKQIFG